MYLKTGDCNTMNIVHSDRKDRRNGPHNGTQLNGTNRDTVNRKSGLK